MTSQAPAVASQHSSTWDEAEVCSDIYDGSHFCAQNSSSAGVVANTAATMWFVYVHYCQKTAHCYWLTIVVRSNVWLDSVLVFSDSELETRYSTTLELNLCLYVLSCWQGFSLQLVSMRALVSVRFAVFGRKEDDCLWQVNSIVVCFCVAFWA